MSSAKIMVFALLVVKAESMVRSIPDIYSHQAVYQRSLIR